MVKHKIRVKPTWLFNASDKWAAVFKSAANFPPANDIFLPSFFDRRFFNKQRLQNQISNNKPKVTPSIERLTIPP